VGFPELLVDVEPIIFEIRSMVKPCGSVHKLEMPCQYGQVWDVAGMADCQRRNAAFGE